VLTVLDVLDNFFDSERTNDVRHMSGAKLYELGDELQRFAEAQLAPSIDLSRHPVYLGGWPSANFWLAEQGQLVMSSLLYAGQVIVTDPLVNWFDPAQYHRPRKMAGRPGYLRAETGEPAVAETRQFLSTVVPALMRLRPLIERQVLVLVPSERVLLAERAAVDALTRGLDARLRDTTLEIVHEFSPPDLAVEDNVRGAFVFAGGDREEQLSKAVREAAAYFAREYVLARAYGANYVAPFRFEQYLCEQGLDKLLAESPGERVIHALLHSSLPLYTGLTPKIVADIHTDSHYAEFREQLYNVYRDVPTHGSAEETARYLMEAEEALLRPSLDGARAEVERGFFAGLGVRVADLTMSLVTSLAVATVFSPEQSPVQVAAEAGVREGIAGLLRSPERMQGPVPVWQKLYAHHRTVRDELERVSVQEPLNSEGPEFWGIPRRAEHERQRHGGLSHLGLPS
jgi:hypothetical protein